MREGSLKAPVRHPVDWQNPDFYDDVKLDAELRRVFDICHGCRRCFNLCDSFPQLFDLIDATSSGEVRDVKSEDFKAVADECTLCDMCFMTKCPYVPPHEFNLDFPHLMLRYRAKEEKQNGTSFADKEITATDRNGELATYAAPLVNWATDTNNAFMRGAMATLAGIHPEARLPLHTSKTFLARAQKNEPSVDQSAPAYGLRKVVLYATCSINYNDPDLGIVTRAVLAKNGIECKVAYPGCCGMPQLEQGNIAQVVENARKVATEMAHFVDEGYDIVALVPSCALMLKSEWPLLVPKDDPVYPRILKLAQATFDLSEFMVDIAKRHGLADGLKPLSGPVALHLACHARAQNMGPKAADMLRLLPGSEDILVIERCSGHGGAWGIKKDNFETALKVGKPVARKASDLLKEAEHKQKNGFVASECPLAGAHILQGIERLADAPPQIPGRAFHPIEIFAMSYGILREAS